MIKNYLLVCVRNALNQRFYSAIKIFGLGLGIACCIPILLLVYYEWSYDNFHQNGADIYRVLNQRTSVEGDVEFSVLQPVGLAATFAEAHPSILNASSYIRSQTYIERGEKKFWQRLGLVAPSFLQIFSFPLVAGDPATALDPMDAIVISEEMARKFFGETDGDYAGVLGQRLSLDEQDFVIMGVMQPVPEASSLEFDALLSIEHYENFSRNASSDTFNGGSIEKTAIVYVQLAAGQSPQEVEATLSAVAQSQWGAFIASEKERGDIRDTEDGFLIKLQPLDEVHFDFDLMHAYEKRSNPMHTYVAMGIAFLVLFIACTNFMTLSIGQSVKRAREVSMRKVLGAQRGQLLRQFWGEALLLTLVALVLGVALAELFMQPFNELAQQNLSLFYFGHWPTLLSFVGLMVIVALVAGSYPALLISRFQPIDALKTQLHLGGRNVLTRALVVVQYALSIALMISAAIMQQQLDYMHGKDLGFASEEVVVVSALGNDTQAVVERYKNEVLKSTQVVAAAVVDRSFTDGSSRNRARTKDGREVGVRIIRIDPDYLQTMGIDLVAGRDFSTSDGQGLVLVNEAAVKAFAWENPIGAVFENSTVGQMYAPTVIGVFKDYHIDSLHRQVQPLVLHMGSIHNRMSLMVRMHPGTAAETLSFLKETWQEVAPDRPVRYAFLDEMLDRQYRDEERWGRIVGYAFFFAILLSCLGLLGLASLAVTRQTREIGIRKVLGASVADVMMLLSKDFVKLVLLANLLAWPLAAYVAQSWLQNFAYRIDLGPGVFALSGVLALAVALGTLSLQTAKAALANPVEALRRD